VGARHAPDAPKVSLIFPIDWRRTSLHWRSRRFCELFALAHSDMAEWQAVGEG
jgi:hypothetical protein